MRWFEDVFVLIGKVFFMTGMLGQVILLEQTDNVSTPHFHIHYTAIDTSKNVYLSLQYSKLTIGKIEHVCSERKGVHCE